MWVTQENLEDTKLNLWWAQTFWTGGKNKCLWCPGQSIRLADKQEQQHFPLCSPSGRKQGQWKQLTAFSNPCADHHSMSPRRVVATKTAGDPLFRLGYRFAGLKPLSQFCRQQSILVWIAVCWFSSNILLSSRNPKSNCWLSRIFEDRFGGKRLQFVTIQLLILTRRRIRCIFVWSGSDLWSLFKNSKSKLKNQKPIAVDVLFKAFPLWGWSNLAGRYRYAAKNKFLGLRTVCIVF